MTNNIPKKSKSEMQQLMYKLLASGVVGTMMFAGITHTTYGAEIKTNESSYIEKDATSTDPSLRHSSIMDIKQLPSYIGSSFVDKFNDLDSKKQDNTKDKPLMDESNKDKSYLKLNHNDYLHYVSANGDNVIVHYVDSDGNPLGFSKSADDSDDSNNNNDSHSSSGFFMFPFMLGGNSYSSSGGAMHSDMKGTTGKNAYGSSNTKSFGSNTSRVSKNVSNSSTSKSSVSSSSRGMGSSMSNGGRGASSGGGS